MVYMTGSAIVLQLYLDSMGATPFQVSLLEVVFWGGMLLVSPLWGAISDASGRRKIFLAISILIAGLIIPLFYYTETIGGVLGLRFVFALIAVAFPPVALAAMSQGAKQADRGKSLAAYNTSRAVGFFLGWGGAGLVLQTLGFQHTFLLFGGVGVLGFAAALLVRDIDTPEEVSLQEVWDKAKQRWTPSRDDASFQIHGLNYLYASLFLRKAGFIGIMSLIAMYTVGEVGISEAFLGYMMALNPLSQLVFINLFGSMTDRYGRKKIFLIGFLSSIPFPLLLLYAANPAALAMSFILLGFSYAALVEGSTAFIGDVAPNGRQGEFMGFRKSSQGLAGVCGPLLAGFLATRYGFPTMLLAMAVLITAGFLVAWRDTEESLHEPGMHDSIAKDIVSRVRQ